MDIKRIEREKKPIDVSEWNETAKAFFKPLNGFEELVFNDYFIIFYDRDQPTEARFDAGFKAAKLALVDENDAPLLDESDRAAILSASFKPILRVFTTGLELETGEIESAKKN